LSVSTTTTPTSTANTTSSQLTNTGPGNVIALFIGVVTLSSLIHYVYTKKHLKNLSKSDL
jgi:hypothetical protein